MPPRNTRLGPPERTAQTNSEICVFYFRPASFRSKDHPGVQPPAWGRPAVLPPSPAAVLPMHALVPSRHIRHQTHRTTPSASRHQRHPPSPSSARASPSMHRSGLQDEGDAWAAALTKGPHEDAPDHWGPEFPLAAPHTHCSNQDQLEWARVLDRTPAPPTTTSAERTAAAGPNTPHPRDQALESPGPSSPSPLPDPMAARPLAVVIECGSHSTRSLICDHRGRELARICIDTHMAAGLVAGGPLEPGAVQRCTAALEAVHAEVQRLSRGGGEGSQQVSPGTQGGLAAGVSAADLEGQGRGEAASLLGAGDRQEGAPKVAVAAVGTMALRQCSNPGALSQHVQRLFGVQLRVLSGEEEGKLAYRGASLRHQPGATDSSPSMPAGGQTKVERSAGVDVADEARPVVVVVDMGGMSTELTWLQGGQGLQVLSVPLGSVALTASFFADGSDSPGAVVKCMEHVREVLSREGGALRALRAQLEEQNKQADQGGQQRQPDGEAVSLHGSSDVVCGAAGPVGAALEVALVGGTATTAAALLLQLPAYDSVAVSSSSLSCAQLLGLAHSLAGARPGQEEGADHQRAMGAGGGMSGGGGGNAAAAAQAELLCRYPWLSVARAQTLAAGACCLAAVLEWMGVDAARVSDADLLDGLMAEVLEHQPRI